MKAETTLWKKIYFLALTIFRGLLATLSGVIPWTILAGLNFKLSPSVPWSVPLMAIFLWFYWRFWKGEFWFKNTKVKRKDWLRGNAVPNKSWLPLSLFFVSGFILINSVKVIINTLTNAPIDKNPDILKYPIISVISYVAMIAIVAAFTEEIGFRGYMQGPFEKKYSPLKSIVIVGVVFWLGHISQIGTRPDIFLFSIWYFVSVSILLGYITYWTNSIIPAIVFHAVGDFIFISSSLMAGIHGFSLEKTALNSNMFYVCIVLAVLTILSTSYFFKKIYKMNLSFE